MADMMFWRGYPFITTFVFEPDFWKDLGYTDYFDTYIDLYIGVSGYHGIGLGVCHMTRIESMYTCRFKLNTLVPFPFFSKRVF